MSESAREAPRGELLAIAATDRDAQVLAAHRWPGLQDYVTVIKSSPSVYAVYVEHDEAAE